MLSRNNQNKLEPPTLALKQNLKTFLGEYRMLTDAVNIFDAFIEGAKEGFQTAILIIPYLVAMLVAIGVFRASGALDLLADLARVVVHYFMLDDRFVDALPTALMKPFSGSGARAMMIDTMKTHGADSFAGRLASIVQGSTETTFYVLAIYFGSVGVKRIRHAVACGIIADFAGIGAAIFVASACTKSWNARSSVRTSSF